MTSHVMVTDGLKNEHMNFLYGFSYVLVQHVTSKRPFSIFVCRSNPKLIVAHENPKFGTNGGNYKGLIIYILYRVIFMYTNKYKRG